MARIYDYDSPDEFRRNRGKRRGLGGWQKFLLAFFIASAVLALALFGTVGYYKYIYKPKTPVTVEDFPYSSVQVSETDGDDTPTAENTMQRTEQCYTFLAVGCDRAAWLSDVIMLAKYDVKEKKCAIMQVPRDTYVRISSSLILADDGSVSAENFDGVGDYACKVNAVLGQGGAFAANELARLASLAGGASESELENLCEASFLPVSAEEMRDYLSAGGSEREEKAYDIRMKFAMKYLSAFVKYAFGMPIDYCAQVNLDGFVSIVDAIGGVDVYVQQDMNYDDPYQDLHIHIKQGQQHLNGHDAEGFVRFRYGYVAADIARIDAQKIFMTAFIKKMASVAGVMNINDIIKEIDRNLLTNLSLPDALYFATHALDIDLSEIVMLTLPGTPQYIGDVSYYTADKATLISYVNEYLNKYDADLDENYFLVPEIGGGNTSTVPLTAQDITDDQPDLGFIR